MSDATLNQPMSAKRQKQTFCDLEVMSARKRTCAVQLLWANSGHQQAMRRHYCNDVTRLRRGWPLYYLR
jgi:hypothetical protein